MLFDKEMKAIIESLLFITNTPLSVEDIAEFTGFKKALGWDCGVYSHGHGRGVYGRVYRVFSRGRRGENISQRRESVRRKISFAIQEFAHGCGIRHRRNFTWRRGASVLLWENRRRHEGIFAKILR